MSDHNELLDLYSQILHSTGAIVHKDGSVTTADGETLIMLKIGKLEKALVLPTPEVLRHGDWTKLVAFHPACESIYNGQSEVINALTRLCASRLHTCIQMAVGSVVELATNKAVHGKLNLAQKELLIECGEVDTPAVKILSEIIRRNTGVKGKFPLLTLRLDRGGEIDDECYSRTCRIIPHVILNEDSFCGVKPGSKQTRAEILALYQYMFPEQQVYGSNSKNAPYLMALLECYYQCAKHLNQIRTVLGKYGNIPLIDINWHEHIKHISVYAKRHLPQTMPGNTGINLAAEKTQADQDEEVIPSQKSTGHAEVPSEYEGPLTKRGLVRLSTTLPHATAPAPVNIQPPGQNYGYQPEVIQSVYPPQYNPQMQHSQPLMPQNQPQQVLTSDNAMAMFMQGQQMQQQYQQPGYGQQPNYGPQPYPPQGYPQPQQPYQQPYPQPGYPQQQYQHPQNYGTPMMGRGQNYHSYR